MSLRTTLISLGLLVLLCGGMLYAVHNVFSREAQMRDAARDFEQRHRGEMKSAQEAAIAEANSRSRTDSAPETADVQQPDQAAFDQPPSLDDWYASAGKQNGPFDPTPEIDDSLINSAEPYVTVE